MHMFGSNGLFRVKDRIGYLPGLEAFSIGLHGDLHRRLSRYKMGAAKLLAELEPLAQQASPGPRAGHGGRRLGHGLVNVGFRAFHEGRGARKMTTPGGREKNAYFSKRNLFHG